MQVGKAIVVRDGSDLTLISTGALLWTAVQVAELLHPNGTKAAALAALAARYGLTMADVVAVGDGHNDVEMLEEMVLGAMNDAIQKAEDLAASFKRALDRQQQEAPAKGCCSS